MGFLIVTEDVEKYNFYKDLEAVMEWKDILNDKKR